MRFYFVFVLSTSVLEKTQNFFKNKNALPTTRFGGKYAQKKRSGMSSWQCDYDVWKMWINDYYLQNDHFDHRKHKKTQSLGKNDKEDYRWSFARY